MGMSFAMIAIILLMSIGTYYVSKYRITQHVQQNYGGTFQLIGEGVARHNGDKKEQWLSAIENLSNLEFNQFNFATGPLSKLKIEQLNNEKFIFQIDYRLAAGKVFILLPNKTSYLQVDLSDFGSSLVRLSAFLMLNELGRHKNEQRLLALENLRVMFNYPIQLKTLASLHIPTINVRHVKKGNISVVLNNSTTSTPSLMAYAPLGNSPYALVLGNIPFFDWFPLPLIMGQIIFILLLMAVTSFLLVKPLENRLKNVDLQIERIGHDKSLSMHTPVGSDAIGKLSNTVNSMSTRIHKLIDAQDDMISAISHELRTPITRIRFRMEMVEKLNSENYSQQSEGIERDLNELETLIDEVLTFSKLKRGLPDLNKEIIPIKELLADLTKSAKIVNSNIKINMSLSIQGNIYADRRYIFRALENLLVNALKYAKNNIELNFKDNHHFQYISIEDDGIGIPPKERNLVFEPFKRLDASRDRQSGGYGLGLAIVKQISNWHQGDVKISTSTLGGAKITLVLPDKVNCDENT